MSGAGVGEVDESLLEAPADPLGAIPAVVAACPGENHTVHERDGEWWVGIGTAAEVIADETGVVLRHGDRVVELPPSPWPWGQTEELLARLDHPWSACGWVSADPGERAGPRLHLVVPAALLRIGEHGARLSGPDQNLRDRLAAALADHVPGRGSARPAAHGTVEIDTESNAASYREAVTRASEAISAGRLHKVVLSRRIPIDSPIDFPATYLAGRRLHDPARSVLLSMGEIGLVGFCPETIICVEPDGSFTSEPLAGTRGAPPDPHNRARLSDELRWNPKEVFEHAVSVRAMLEDLDDVSDTVAADDLLSVRRRGSAQHLASRLRGQLAPGRSAWDAFAAVFPTVTGTGLPRRRALELIDDLEPAPRGLYAGAAVRVDHDGTFDSALILRAVHRHRGRSWLQAGGGIVAGADPDREVEETREKLSSIIESLVPLVAMTCLRGRNGP